MSTTTCTPCEVCGVDQARGWCRRHDSQPTDVQALIDAVRTAGLDLAAVTRTEQRITDDWFAGKKQHDDVKAARTAADAAAHEFGRAIGRLKEAVR